MSLGEIIPQQHSFGLDWAGGGCQDRHRRWRRVRQWWWPASGHGAGWDREAFRSRSRCLMLESLALITANWDSVSRDRELWHWRFLVVVCKDCEYSVISSADWTWRLGLKAIWRALVAGITTRVYWSLFTDQRFIRILAMHWEGGSVETPEPKDWEAWSECTDSCGGGSKTRRTA